MWLLFCGILESPCWRRQVLQESFASGWRQLSAKPLSIDPTRPTLFFCSDSHIPSPVVLMVLGLFMESLSTGSEHPRGGYLCVTSSSTLSLHFTCLFVAEVNVLYVFYSKSAEERTIMLLFLFFFLNCSFFVFKWFSCLKPCCKQFVNLNHPLYGHFSSSSSLVCKYRCVR